MKSFFLGGCPNIEGLKASFYANKAFAFSEAAAATKSWGLISVIRSMTLKPAPCSIMATRFFSNVVQITFDGSDHKCTGKGKKYYHLRFTDKEMRITKRRLHEQSAEFKDRYRWRAGVEATMSEYDRRTGVKQLRVRGFKAVRFCATLKALGVNIFRAAAFQATKMMPEEKLCQKKQNNEEITYPSIKT